MLAIKYRDDFPAWPAVIRKNVTVLPEGFTALISESDYILLLSNNQAAYNAFKISLTIQTPEQIEQVQAQKFKQIRRAWQDIADKFAGGNVGSGINTAQATALADAFSTVEHYLRLNVPSKALAEIDNIVPIEPFLPASKLVAMKLEFYGHIQQIFGV